MSIKKFNNQTDYNNAGYPTNESRIAVIADSGEVKVDGVNVMTRQPVLGDAVYKKDNKHFYFKGGDAINNTLLTAKGYSPIGQVYGNIDGKIAVIDAAISSAKYCDVLQYAITAITSTTPTITLYNSSGVAQTINVTLTSTDIDSTTAAEISAAVASVDSYDWWAYLDGDRIIVQCDNWPDYRQYQCSMSGGTISFVVWEDMPSDSWYMKVNGQYSNYRGLMNIARGNAYWSADGRTPDSNVAVHSEAGNTNPMSLSAFNNSAYAADIRAFYPTYEDYLRGEFGIIYPQKYGCFADSMDAKTLTKKYGNKTAPTKGGSTKYKFPALHYALTVGYGISGLSTGDWFLNGVADGTIFLEDNNMAVINATRIKMGHTALSNNVYRWFAQRYHVYYAWFFYGGYGDLNYTNVCYGYSVQAVALLDD